MKYRFFFVLFFFFSFTVLIAQQLPIGTELTYGEYGVNSIDQSFLDLENSIYFVIQTETGPVSEKYLIKYDNEFKEVWTKSVTDKQVSLQNSQIYISDDETIDRYNTDGELLSTIELPPKSVYTEREFYTGDYRGIWVISAVNEPDAAPFFKFDLFSTFGSIAWSYIYTPEIADGDEIHISTYTINGEGNLLFAWFLSEFTTDADYYVQQKLTIVSKDHLILSEHELPIFKFILENGPYNYYKPNFITTNSNDEIIFANRKTVWLMDKNGELISSLDLAYNVNTAIDVQFKFIACEGLLISGFYDKYQSWMVNMTNPISLKWSLQPPLPSGDYNFTYPGYIYSDNVGNQFFRFQSDNSLRFDTYDIDGNKINESKYDIVAPQLFAGAFLPANDGTIKITYSASDLSEGPDGSDRYMTEIPNSGINSLDCYSELPDCHIKLFPNPNRNENYLYVYIPTDPAKTFQNFKYEVINSAGQLIKSFNGPEQYKFLLTGFAHGLYFLRITGANETQCVEEFIVN